MCLSKRNKKRETSRAPRGFGYRRLRGMEELESRVLLSTLPEFVYGLPSDRWHFMGDWDGDGVDTPAIFRDGIWHLRNSNTSGVADSVFYYGVPGDTPIVGDWDGDGIDTVGIVRGAIWHLRNSNTSGVADTVFNYGLPGDKPFVGDWDGDGIDTPGIVRSDLGHLRNTNDTGVADIVFEFQAKTGVCVGFNCYSFAPGSPVVGDWNGDGIDTPGLFDAGIWHLGRFRAVSTVFSRGTGQMMTADVQFIFGSAEDAGLRADFGTGSRDVLGAVNGATSVWHFVAPASFAGQATNPLAVLPPAEQLPGSVGGNLRQKYAEYLEFLSGDPQPGEILRRRFAGADIHTTIPSSQQRLQDILNGVPGAEAALEQDNAQFAQLQADLATLGAVVQATDPNRALGAQVPLDRLADIAVLPNVQSVIGSTAILLASPLPESDVTVADNAGQHLKTLYAEYLAFRDSNPSADVSFTTSEMLLLTRTDGFVAVDVGSTIPLDPPFEPGLYAAEFEGFIAKLRAAGMEVFAAISDLGPVRLVGGWVPILALPEISRMTEVLAIWPGMPIRNAVTSQGDAVVRADQARSSFGIDGAGVTVGVLSDSATHVDSNNDGIRGIAESQATSDLPASVNVLLDCSIVPPITCPRDSLGDPFPGDEVRAMLEIVYDIAP
ncbi:MAG: hypothetical protein HY000_38120, partial [Planctomycetes bacterium]|nr:hypothetical protein [Planctomycetota bacterium]